MKLAIVNGSVEGLFFILRKKNKSMIHTNRYSFENNKKNQFRNYLN